MIKRTWTAFWRITLFLILWALFYAPALLLIDLEPPDGRAAISREVRLYLELIGALAVIAAAWLLTRIVDHRAFVSLGFASRGAVRDLLIGLVFGSAMISLSVATLWSAGWAETVPVLTFSWPVLGVMGAAILFNSVIQEVIVRGYVLQTIERQFNVSVAVIASSVFFAMLHAGAIAEGGILPAVNLFAAGVLLGLAYTTTRNLWLPIALHFSWNFLQGPVLGIAVSGQALDSGWQVLNLKGPAIFTGGSFGLEGGLVATLVTTLGIVALIAAGRRPGQHGSLTVPGPG